MNDGIEQIIDKLVQNPEMLASKCSYCSHQNHELCILYEGDYWYLLAGKSEFALVLKRHAAKENELTPDERIECDGKPEESKPTGSITTIKSSIATLKYALQVLEQSIGKVDIGWPTNKIPHYHWTLVPMNPFQGFSEELMTRLKSQFPQMCLPNNEPGKPATAWFYSTEDIKKRADAQPSGQ